MTYVMDCRPPRLGAPGLGVPSTLVACRYEVEGWWLGRGLVAWYEVAAAVRSQLAAMGSRCPAKLWV
jgi:hypothetical protein